MSNARPPPHSLSNDAGEECEHDQHNDLTPHSDDNNEPPPSLHLPSTFSPPPGPDLELQELSSAASRETLPPNGHDLLLLARDHDIDTPVHHEPHDPSAENPAASTLLPPSSPASRDFDAEGYSTPVTEEDLDPATAPLDLRMSRTPLLNNPVSGTGYGGIPSSSRPRSRDHDRDEDDRSRTFRIHRGRNTRLQRSDPGQDGNHGTYGRRSFSLSGRDTSNETEGEARRRKNQSSSVPRPRPRSRRLPSHDFAGQVEFGIGGERLTLEIDRDPAPGPKLDDEENPESSSPSDSDRETLGTSTTSARSPSARRRSRARRRAKRQDTTPYAQVRANTRQTDDITLSINTPRMWFFSMLFAVLGSATNMFFSLRYPSVSINPTIALLLVHPLGKLWDAVWKRSGDPVEGFVDGWLAERTARTDRPARGVGRVREGGEERWQRRWRLWLAQGRWNYKEHCCVYIASNVSFSFAFATDVIVEQKMFYHQDLGVLYQILLVLSTQILGYSLAGVTRIFLVRSSGMIWPGALTTAGLFNTLYEKDNAPADGWTISRARFFSYVFLGSMAFYLLPGLLVPAMSYFNVMTWFAPRNIVVANLFGVVSGLGLFPMTFDWAQIAYIGSPLIVPFHAAMNVMAGMLSVMWIAAPLLYYSNVLYSSYMPILSSSVFDNRGHVYDVSKILTKDFLLDIEAYQEYSRVFLPITYVLSYGMQFAGLSSLLTHTICKHGKDIVKLSKDAMRQARTEAKKEYRLLHDEDDSEPIQPMRSRTSTDMSGSASPDTENLMDQEDVHARLMRRYDDVPMWWYLLTGLSMLGLAIFTVEYYPIHLPWYGLVLALGTCTILFIPIGIINATTNQSISIYILCQLICGYAFPGRPVANMVFTTYGYITAFQGIKFASDLKLGHYMKIPPRTLFVLQLAATFVASFTQLGVMNWMLAHIPGICSPDAINGFTCPLARVHFNGSILWGLVGPQRFFGGDGLYARLLWAFPVGALTPILVWYLARVSTRSRPFWRKVNLPIFFSGLSWIPPATGLNFSVWALVNWVFNDLVARHRREWWKKYTMMLSAALDSGLAVGVTAIFFGFLYPGWMEGFSWWGTEVYKEGCDWQACAYKDVPKGGFFGPKTWR
ncbi:OPT-domain-containing protein [Eremomyces bilateralis CBS 781.70]|uniref:OPT-domain-containing protein n=1 Tax=Eremomyces bilateralis CBS 781.70 TaxID=1392243 RepID=A0A6G1G4G2_9PEZI|nr:OPT-domain-containing protein [Eremomyces bilateralis CBS 781.70]KAF1812954.1 OPT-domain-containing protein [Eremomyces bilateralis CBS 781.70]